MAKWLIILGIVLILAGVLWPWLAKLGLGHLPGDFHIKRGEFEFYFPLTSSILISVALSLILWLLRR